MLKYLNKLLNKLGYTVVQLDEVDSSTPRLKVFLPVEINISNELYKYIYDYFTERIAVNDLEVRSICNIIADLDYKIQTKTYEHIKHLPALLNECWELKTNYGNFILERN